MKKTNLTRSLLAACSIVALSAVMYGCSSSGEDTQRERAEGAEMTNEQLQAALAAARAAQATAEAERDTANAAAAAAAQAQAAAEAAQATAETERDNANAAAATAAQAQMDAEAAQATAEAAQAAAEMAQAAAESAQADAETAQAAAEAAQAAAETRAADAETARSMAEDARAAAAAAQATAEAQRDAANMAAAAAAQAQMDAEAAQSMAEADRDAANAAAAVAAQAQADAEAAQAAAEADRDAANAAAAQAALDQAAAEMAQATAEGERDAANMARDAANDARDAAITERDNTQMALDQANMDLATANSNLETANTDLAAAITRAETAEADLATANADLEQARADLKAANDRIAALIGGTAPEVLDPVKKRASDAATAAGTASTAAGEAADAAEMAAMNRATIQTGDANSVMDAYAARMAANDAADEAKKASDASDMAQAATDTAGATPHAMAAEAAQAAAEEDQMDAEAAQDEAEADAMVELKIDDKTKSVGGTSIEVDGRRHTSSNGRTHTGLLDGMDIMQMGLRDANGHLLVDADGNAVTGVGAAANIDIGFTYDSEDDDARLTLIHSYLGTMKQKQFIRPADTASTVTGSPFAAVPDATNISPEAPDEVGSEDNIPTGTVEVPYAAANTALGLTGAAALEAPTTPTLTRTATGVAGIPRSAGAIALAFDDLDSAPPVLYFIHTNVRDNSLVGDEDDGIDQTRIFLERRVIGNNVTYDVVHVREVTVESAMEYAHIHYGLWNGISGRDGNTVSELGIGFVTALADGEGMTDVGDMPNVGTLSYSGNWVANVQMAGTAAGDGEIRRRNGMATIMADIDDNDVTVTLTGLASLEGDIDGNMFSGTKVTLLDADATTADVVDPAFGLGGASSDFTGTFSGGFFGPRAAEAGGVFDYSSEDNEEGAFRGSFGGAR